MSLPTSEDNLLGNGKAVAFYEGRSIASSISNELKRAANKARAPSAIISGGGGFRARRADRYFWLGFVASFFILVALPMAIASIYFGLIASNQYVTEARLAIKTGDSSVMDAISGATGLSFADQNQTGFLIASYITSRALVEDLSKDIDLRAAFSDESIDYFSRFDSRKPIEEFVKYWERQVSVNVDRTTGILSLEFRAFTPQQSLQIIERIIVATEKLANDIALRSQRDVLRISQVELRRAEDRLRNATLAMRDLRNSEGLVDTTSAANAIQKLITGLKFELSQLEQQMAVQSKDLGSGSPQMRILKVRIENLKSQISGYAAQLAGYDSPSTDNLAGQMSKFSLKQIDLHLAERQYASAVAAYESARIDLETQHVYVVSVLKPSLPEKSIYPHRLWNFFLVSIAAVTIWGILASLSIMARNNVSL